MQITYIKIKMRPVSNDTPLLQATKYITCMHPRVTNAAHDALKGHATKDTRIPCGLEHISNTFDFTTARLEVSNIHCDILQSVETERILL